MAPPNSPSNQPQALSLPVPCQPTQRTDGKASLLNLPPELFLHICEALTDLKDLCNLLDSSQQLSKSFGEHMRGLLNSTIIPRLAPLSIQSVKTALQAACSHGNMRYKCLANEPVFVVTDAPKGALLGAWIVHDARYDIWHPASTGFLNPKEVLQRLLNINAEVHAFRHLIQHGTSISHQEANKYSDIYIQRFLWNMQAHFLRFGNVFRVDWLGDKWSAPKTLGNKLESISRFWYIGLSEGRKHLLRWLFGITGIAQRGLRRHFITLPINSMPFHLTQAVPYNLERLTRRIDNTTFETESVATMKQHAPLPDRPVDPADYEQHCCDKMEEKEPMTLRPIDSAEYEEHCLAAYRDHSMAIRFKQLWFARGGKPDRVARIKTNLATYLWPHWPKTGLAEEEAEKLVAQIGRLHGEKVDRLEANSILAKHIRLVAIDNGYGQPQEDMDDILCDVGGCMNRVLREWVVTRREERKHGIAHGVVVPKGFVFSGVA